MLLLHHAPTTLIAVTSGPAANIQTKLAALLLYYSHFSVSSCSDIKLQCRVYCEVVVTIVWRMVMVWICNWRWRWWRLMTGKSGGSLNTIADNATILSSSSSRYKTIQNDDIKIKYLGLISWNRVSLIPFYHLIFTDRRKFIMWEPISLGQSFFTSFPISHETFSAFCCHSGHALNILPFLSTLNLSSDRVF